MKSRIIRILGIVFIVELYLQVFSFARFGWSEFVKKQNEHDVFIRTWALQNKDFRVIYDEESSIREEYYPFLGWRMHELHTPHINVNAEGVRDTVGNPDLFVSDMKKIYFFGGSTTWGEGVSDKNSIPSLISQEVNTESPFTEITNFGELGYGQTQEIFRLILLLKSGKIPDYVVFYDGCNDLFSETLDEVSHVTLHDTSMKARLGNIWELTDDGKIAIGTENTSVFSGMFWRKVFRAVATYVQIVRYPLLWYERIVSLKETVPERTPELSLADTERYSDNIADNYIGNIQILDALSKHYKFDYLLIWQPTIYSRTMTEEETKLPDFQPEQYRELSKIYRRSSEKLAGSGIRNYVDFSHIFDGIKENVYTDTCHVTPQANAHVGKEIRSIIKSKWRVE